MTDPVSDHDRGRAGPVGRPGHENAALLLMTLGSAAFGLFLGPLFAVPWLAGAVMLWRSLALRRGEKLLATLVFPGGPGLAWTLMFAHGLRPGVAVWLVAVLVMAPVVVAVIIHARLRGRQATATGAATATGQIGADNQDAEYSRAARDPHLDRVRAGAWAAVAGVAASVPVLVWWAVGDVSAGPDYQVGFYEIGATLGRIALLAAAVVLPVALADLARRQARGQFGWTGWVFILLVAAAGALAAFGWRVITAGVDGANIGGDGAALLGPVQVAGLLLLAGWLRPRFRPVPLARPLWAVGAAALAVALYVALGFTMGHTRKLAVPSEGQYALVQVGQTRPAVHTILGGPAQAYDSVAFPRPSPPGQRCEYYLAFPDAATTTKTGAQVVTYQFCFRHKFLVSKARRFG